MFLPVLVNPTAPRASGAAPIAPTPTTTPTPTAFRRRMPEKFTKRYHPVIWNKEGIIFISVICVS